MAALEGERLAGVRQARARARARVWQLAGAPRRMILDLDATLITAHSDKERAAGNYKHGFGFHPLLCYEATSEEALAGILRPGNAGANTAADHVEVLGLALAQLPQRVKGPGLLVRADSGGATHGFLDHVASLGLCFSVGFDLTEPVREAVLAVPERAWRPALTQAGEPKDGAAVGSTSPVGSPATPDGYTSTCHAAGPGASSSKRPSNAYAHSRKRRRPRPAATNTRQTHPPASACQKPQQRRPTPTIPPQQRAQQPPRAQQDRSRRPRRTGRPNTPAY